ncbi:MAG: tRNA (guanosine(46)-N7)-methyltransferase TrmB [Eubacterium sp.]|nr:tRNA (guanosine(46)-N7)-methyltransferase TrmB [Eubacterium sp.]
MRLRNIPGAKEAIENNEYVIHNPAEQKGNWKNLFNNTNPIHVEIGMGKGQFIMTLAAENPNINYIGIERYSSVLLRALQKMEETPLNNILFICEDATLITDIFGEEEVDKIYLNFSDPWPKDRHAKRRLTSVQFLERYNVILNKEGKIEFKTDNTDLFNFSLEAAKEANWNIEAFTYDLHNDLKLNKGNVMTEYEEKFSAKGNPINKMIISR